MFFSNENVRPWAPGMGLQVGPLGGDGFDEACGWGPMLGFVSLEGEEDTGVLSLPREDAGGSGRLEPGRGFLGEPDCIGTSLDPSLQPAGTRVC